MVVSIGWFSPNLYIGNGWLEITIFIHLKLVGIRVPGTYPTFWNASENHNPPGSARTISDKWYILPIGGLYATYHLLGEPETAIEKFPFLKPGPFLRSKYFWSCDGCSVTGNPVTVFSSRAVVITRQPEKPRKDLMIHEEWLLPLDPFCAVWKMKVLDFMP